MASSAPLADIEERFFWCSVCHEPFNDPKQLPCLHRYCRHCLDGIIAGFEDSFRCPLCQQKHKIPKDGAAGYKTDFHIKSVVEFLQLQTSYEQDGVKNCHGCETAKEVVAYCFKCKNFLCDQCHDFHLKNNMVAEHRPHTLNLKNADMKSLTLDKLSSLTEDPRCATHVKHLAQLCCESCGNLPICVACTYGGHSGHKVHDVKVLASSEREKLKAILAELDGYKDRLYELPRRVDDTRQRLKQNVDEKLRKAESEHKQASEAISAKIEVNSAALQERKRQLREKKEEVCKQVEQEREQELEKVRQKYDSILKDKEDQYNAETARVEEQHGKMNDTLSAEHVKLDEKLGSFKEKVGTNLAENERGLQEIADHAGHTINRFENYTGTSSTVLASNDEWTDARCLPDITSASGPLITEVKKEFKELEPLTDIGVDDLSLQPIAIPEREVSVRIAECKESVVDIKGFKGSECWVMDITTIGEGHIIVTGFVSSQYSHITHVNKEGGVIRQDRIGRASEAGYYPWRYCSALSRSRIATACFTGQVGIYDVSTGVHVKKDLNDRGSDIKCPGGIYGITTDTGGNIYVGCNNGGVLVFDHKLNYQHTLSTPAMSQSVYAMTVHEGHLVICDRYGSGNAYAVTLGDQRSELVYPFTKPSLDGRSWRAYSVCTDSGGFIYMLWADRTNRVLTQYSQDGRELLGTRKVDGDAECITILETGFREELLMATRKTGKLYTFSM